MRRILTGEMMAKADKAAQDTYGLPSLVLMERAALAGVDILRKPGCGFDLTRVLVVAGIGNNGGDALAVARILMEEGIVPDIYICGDQDKGSEAFKKQLFILKAYKASFLTELMEDTGYTTVVDGIFGISLNREVTGEYAICVSKINLYREKGARVMALDMPSGVHATTGQIMGVAVKADLTITFGFCKLGQLLYPGAGCCGQLVFNDIGIPDGVTQLLRDNSQIYILDEDEIKLPERPAYSNKGTFGKILLIAGSEDICGAAVLSGLAAMRMGAGMLRILTHEKNRDTVIRLFPEAMVGTYTEKEPFKKKELEDYLKWCDCIAIGPGIGQTKAAVDLTHFALKQTQVPVVADADALNILARNPELLSGHSQDIVITPHVGEMSRLTGLNPSEITSHLIDTAVDFSRSYDVVTVLKDARTITSDTTGKCIINLSGNSGMATAGSGDVLTGVIAALLASGMRAFKAAALGVALHAGAGDAAAKEMSMESLLARDIIKYLETE